MADSERRQLGDPLNLLLFLKDGKHAEKMGDVAIWLIAV
jgi:hypothetical protein